jgi:deoxycytidylate deaminase
MITRRDNTFLAMARYLCRKSDAKNTHGAVLMRAGRVLGTGFNRNRNHPSVVSEEHILEGCSTHAEEMAIKDANYNAKGATLYVARVNRNGEDRDSMPCKRCQKLIEKVGIKKVVYTTSYGVLYPGKT